MNVLIGNVLDNFKTNLTNFNHYSYNLSYHNLFTCIGFVLYEVIIDYFINDSRVHYCIKQLIFPDIVTFTIRIYFYE
jgi:hypothetical protein